MIELPDMILWAIKTAVVNNVMQTGSNKFQGQGGVQVIAVFLGFHMKIKTKKFHRDSSTISHF